jgi:hypothetical protein
MNSSRFPRLAWLAPGLCLVFALQLSSCGNAGSGELAKRPVGPTLWTLPVLDFGKEEITIDGRTVKVGVARAWETESIRVELMGTQSLLAYHFAEVERTDWLTYASFLKGKEFVVRITDLDLMILEGGPQLKSEGLWLIGPRTTAEARAQELLKRLAAESKPGTSEESAAGD